MKILFTPHWFLNFDVMIEVISFLVLLSFYLLSMKNYKITKNKNARNLGIGFLFIALGELAVILTKIVLYYDTIFTQQIGQAIITYHVLKSVDVFYYAGFFFNKLLTLFGLYLIYRNPIKNAPKKDAFLLIFFIIVSAVFGIISDHIFHITTIILLALILTNYSEICKKNKSPNTKMLIYAFSILLIGHVILLCGLGLLYALGQILQLISYVILLMVIIRILKINKK